MPTDETTLETLAVRMEKSAEWHAAAAKQYAEDTELSAMQARFAAEARLIAESLRFHLAALTAPAAQEGDPESDEAFFARIDARRKARQAQTFAEENQ